MTTPARVHLTALAAVAVLWLAGQSGQAAPLGDPQLSLPAQSVPVASNAKPDGYGYLSGGDGDVADPVWVATTDFGYLLFFNGFDPTPVNVVDTGLAGVTGVAYLGSSRLALSSGVNIYEGYTAGGMWHETGVHGIGGLTSSILDVDYALGHYFIATQHDVRRVESDWTTMLIYDGDGVLSLDLIEFQPNTYDNPMLELGAGDNGFRNADTSGTLFGTARPVELDNTYDIQGLAYFSGGFAVVQRTQADIHTPFTFQQHMTTFSVPEPSSSSLLLAGVGVWLTGRAFRRPRPSPVQPKS